MYLHSLRFENCRALGAPDSAGLALGAPTVPDVVIAATHRPEGFASGRSLGEQEVERRSGEWDVLADSTAERIGVLVLTASARAAEGPW